MNHDGNEDDDFDIGPQQGPQEAFLNCDADIAFYGGQAGAGKTFALLLGAAAFLEVPRYGAVIFRRTVPQITNEGGLWDETMSLYSLPGLDGVPKISTLDWIFPSGANIGFRAIQYEKDLTEWMGAQIAFLGFDEVTHFTKNMFFYMISRCRSTCGVWPHVRATCNPIPADDPIGGWVHEFLQWWIDEETGLAIEERSGVLRWMVVKKGEIFWADSKEECFEKYGLKGIPEDDKRQIKPKSVTFIPAKLSDNPILEEKDPNYRGNLEMQADHIREALLEGNWNAKVRAGTFFKVAKIEIVDALPANLKYCRGWDLAFTENAGDHTVGAKLGYDGKGTYYIADIARGQWETSYRDAKMLQTAQIDKCQQKLPEDPAAGKAEAARLTKMLDGHWVSSEVIRKDKVTMAAGMASQINAGNFKMLKAPWNAGLIQRLDRFPDKGVPDDECFVAGTPILTIRGSIPIEKVVVGDQVMTRFGWRKVEVSQTTHHAAPIWSLVTSDDRVLKCTQRHPFFILGIGMTPLEECAAGMMLVECFRGTGTSSGWDWRSTISIKEIIQSDERAKVYNLCVQDEHEYFANGILVSNCDALSIAYRALAQAKRLVLGFGSHRDKPIIEDDEPPKADHPYKAMLEGKQGPPKPDATDQSGRKPFIFGIG